MSDLLVDAYFRAYADKVVAGGGIPVYLPGEISATDAISAVDGVILSGGPDIDPRLYDREVTDKVGSFNTEQDRFDIQLTLRAAEQGIPVLGSCRGGQIINVAFGGTLIEDLPSVDLHGHNVREFPPSAPRHMVTIDPQSQAHGIYGSAVHVNSFHHQAVAEVGDGLQAVGWADDGTIEAVEHIDLPLVGLQWHPELHEGVDPAFNWLIENTSQTGSTPGRTV